MSSSDDSFPALPEYLQRRIDKAFNQGASNDTDSGGGFFADSGGGFLAEEPGPEQIPLSAIPEALQRLDLPPDDEQVLLVFKNAAAGWKSSTNRPDEIGVDAEAEKLWVCREDWRSVCAVLLEHHAEEYEDSEGGGGGAPYVPESDEDEEEYQDPDAPDDSDSDEYMEGPSTSRRRTRTRRARSSSSSSAPPSISAPKKLTARQTKTCLETYALFFPDASEAELPAQRILIKDLQRVSNLIGDKLKGEEIIEMLEEFSTSPDKSMSFADFGAMMAAAKLA
ncbi:hypothetical protein FB451DRAFT_1257349 [Mycena latifolia]|nr:hypothetical protein FB451DRAFT_1310903 [Mycena latifolia]KAJ7468802.1 hypothetical protein FB451DRAFT_1257349 [Mycena latifolia]